jgi:hypothetical protein
VGWDRSLECLADELFHQAAALVLVGLCILGSPLRAGLCGSTTQGVLWTGRERHATGEPNREEHWPTVADVVASMLMNWLTA